MALQIAGKEKSLVVGLVERKHAPSHVAWNNLHFSKTKICRIFFPSVVQNVISNISIKLIRSEPAPSTFHPSPSPYCSG